jgi:hypothetical protein
MYLEELQLVKGQVFYWHLDQLQGLLVLLPFPKTHGTVINEKYFL